MQNDQEFKRRMRVLHEMERHRETVGRPRRKHEAEVKRLPYIQLFDLSFKRVTFASGIERVILTIKWKDTDKVFQQFELPSIIHLENWTLEEIWSQILVVYPEEIATGLAHHLLNLYKGR